MIEKTVIRGRGPAVPAILILAAVVAASLVSCGLFGASAFPSDLNLIQAQADVSPYVAEEYVNNYTIAAVDVGESRYVLFFSPWNEADVPLVVYDGNLNLMQELTRSEAPFGGTAVTVDASGRILIGNALFDVTTTGLKFAFNVNMGAITNPRWDAAFSYVDPVLPPNTYHIGNFYCNNMDLTWCYWGPATDWTTAPISSPLARIDTSAGSSMLKYRFEGLYSDPTAGSTMLVLVEETKKKFYFVKIPWSDFVNYPSGAMAGMLQYYTYFTRDNVRTDMLGYTAGPDGNAFITFVSDPSSGSGDMFRFRDGTSTLASFHYKNLSDARAAFPLKGDAYYIYDKKKRQIRKTDSWWQ